ncbi:hypothetical protein PQR15_18405 [Streptomyces lydicus]|nr:hypothetical protein [Streptomyces lydicus]
MDYCSSCRRNLNGALVCPGCGDYAPDIAPPGRHRGGAAAAAAAPSWDSWPAEATAASAPHVSSAPHVPSAPQVPDVFDAAPVGSSAAQSAAEGADAGTENGFDGSSSTGQGRAARRRQMARWKKHRRRAAAATAFALAGGALTVALLPNKPSSGQTQAAGSPDPELAGTPRTENTDAASEQPDARASRHLDSRPPRAAGRPPQGTSPASAPAATSRQAAPPRRTTLPRPRARRRTARRHRPRPRTPTAPAAARRRRRGRARPLLPEGPTRAPRR